MPVQLGDCTEIYFSNFVLGDLNDDGLLNVVDVILLINIVLGLEDENPAGELNNDGIINILDVVILVNWILE